jgi:hypothetical protein
LWGDHNAISQDDWDLTEWAMEGIRCGDWPTPLIVTLEYGGVGPVFEERTDEKDLLDQLSRLRQMINSASGA